MSQQTVQHSSTTVGGTGLSGLLGVAFIILKLTGIIAWPWIWVLAPFWIPLAVALLFGALFLGIFAMATSKPKRHSLIRHGGRR